jgi:signal transduction histidine kinase
MPPLPLPSPARFDWSQLLYPGPRRRFTPEEMARAGNRPWPVMVDVFTYLQLGTLLVALALAQRPTPLGWATMGGSVLLAWAVLAVARALWRAPTRFRLNAASYAVAVLTLALAVLLGHWGLRDEVLASMPVVLAILSGVLAGWWILTLARADQIEARLRELDEQAAALRLSTRLAAAQIQPHFLFNTLASLQHWVDTGDARAAPLLRDFTAYLRATLPMFERELQPLADELEMVRRYLAIMQARLGARLAFAVDAPAGLDAELPPGLLLTLTENAITHGIEPQLRGGRIEVQARRVTSGVVLSVRDDGPGLAPGWAEGVGLQNTRRRLLDACPGATLTLSDANPGCLALLILPTLPPATP